MFSCHEEDGKSQQLGGIKPRASGLQLHDYM